LVQHLNIGIVGYGTVGAGVVKNILCNGDLINMRTGLDIRLVAIATRSPKKRHGIVLPKGVKVSSDIGDVVECDDVDVVVELIGGTTVAKDVVLRALANGKSVVTANKALLASCGNEIFAMANSSEADIFYEASVAGGIPVIKSLREGLVANRIFDIYGILNGTCNYILTKMQREDISFGMALQQAQDAGFAEADPSFDVKGIDAAQKLSILASLAYGEWFGTDNIYCEGIDSIVREDISNALELGYNIRLLAIIKQKNMAVQMRVHPVLIPQESLLARVEGEFNAVWIRGDMVGDIMLYGAGAGQKPTASAVVADIVDMALNIRCKAEQRIPGFCSHAGYSSIQPMGELLMRFYLRLQVEDKSGVLSAITKVLGDHSISIASFSQKEVGGDSVPLVMLTHMANENNMQQALKKIETMDEVVEKPVMIRIEDL